MQKTAEPYGDSRLTPDGFNSLLARLHAERGRAGQRYEQLRARLAYFFARRQFLNADVLADEVLTRIAQHVQAGEFIASVEAYAAGVARHVVQEETRREIRNMEAESTYVRNILPSSDTPYIENLEEAMESCLESRAATERQLLIEYYAGRGQALIEHRRRLAASLALSPGALRKRAFRLRESIEDCVRSRLSTRQGNLMNGQYK